MATTEERLLIAIEARQTKLEKEMAKASRNFEAGASKMERRAKTLTTRLNATLAKAGAGVGGQFKNFGAGLLGGIAAGFSVNAARELIDSATRIKNALKAAGLEGNDLQSVYQQLYESAQRNAAPLEGLATLYSRVSLAQKELGVTSTQIVGLVDTVGKAIKLSGGDAAQASGALLQLGQALGGGKIQAEEYNSLIDGLPGLLQAAAAGIDQAGGSVAKLTALVKAGKVSSKAFFDGIQAGAGVIDGRLANAETTISGGFVRLQNVLVDVAARFDDNTHASQTLANMIDTTLIPAIQELGGIFTWISSGPVGDFYNQLGNVIDRVVQLSADLGAMTGLDKIGGNPYIGPQRIQDRIDGAFAGATYPTPKGDRKPMELTVDKGEKVKPITLADYPVTGAGAGGGSRGGSSRATRAQHDAAKELIADLQEEQRLIGASDVEREKSNALRRAGADATEAQKQQIGDLIQRIHDETEANEARRESLERITDAEREFVGGLASDLLHGVSPAEALQNAISRLADTILNDLVDSIFKVKQAGAGGGGGFLSSIFGGLFGGGTSSFVPGILSGSLVGLFADGGHVSGPGSSTSDSIPAYLSDGEFVVNAAATKKNRQLLEAINSGKASGFASGGAVGGSNVARLQTPANSNGPNVTIAPTINLHSNGGDPAQNADLAKQVSKQVEGSIRGLIVDEVQRQTRPGNLLNARAGGR